MSYANILFIISLTYGLIPIVAGIHLKWYPPKYTNRWYGYRSSSSMRNEDTWLEANKYASRLLIFAGLLTTLGTIGYHIFIPSDEIALVATGFLVISMLSIIPITEWHIYKTFDKSGNRK